MLSSNNKNWLVLFGVALPATFFSLIWLNAVGHDDDNLNLLLRVTARLSFMTYLVIFIARPLRQLSAGNATKWLVRERRSLGIAFAAMHTVHLGLIAYRYSTIPGLEYPLSSAAFGGSAYLLIYLMLITSFDAPARALGPKNWRRLHKTGLYFVGLVFLSTLLPEAGDPLFTIERAWFVVLVAGALFIRLTAYFAKRKRNKA